MSCSDDGRKGYESPSQYTNVKIPSFKTESCLSQECEVIGDNNMREVTILCAICLTGYTVLDPVSWAPRGSSCTHVLHRKMHKLLVPELAEVESWSGWCSSDSHQVGMSSVLARFRSIWRQQKCWSQRFNWVKDSREKMIAPVFCHFAIAWYSDQMPWCGS